MSKAFVIAVLILNLSGAAYRTYLLAKQRVQDDEAVDYRSAWLCPAMTRAAGILGQRSR